MAVKGKKKSQTRGSQGRRRPAAAPRPTITATRKVPWYNTTAGRVGGAIMIALLAGAVWWAVADARSESAERARTGEQLEDYVGQIRTLRQNVNQAAAAMAAMPPRANAEVVSTIEDGAQNWANAFTEAQTQSAAIVPPSGEGLGSLTAASQLFNEALQLYESSALTFALVPDAQGKLRNDLLARAVSQRDRATGVWGAATQLVADRFTDLGLEPARLEAPGVGVPPSGLPSPAEGQNGESPAG